MLLILTLAQVLQLDQRFKRLMMLQILMQINSQQLRSLIH